MLDLKLTEGDVRTLATLLTRARRQGQLDTVDTRYLELRLWRHLGIWDIKDALKEWGYDT